MSTMEVSNLTKEFLQKMFSEGKRFDGRGLMDLNKEVTIEYGVSNKAEGSARVKIGKTEVIAGVKLAVGTPYPDSPDAGNLVVSGDLLPLASPRFESGPPGFAGIEISRLVDRVIRESGMLEWEKLVIKSKEKVWTVYIDMYPLNDDGSLIDASCIAAVAALHNATLPGLNKEGNIDYEKKTKDKIPLTKDIIPLSFTFYKLNNSIILHPLREEEEACEAKITFGASYFNGKFMVNSCQKGFETPFTTDELNKMIDMIQIKYDELSKKLNKAFK